MTGSTDAGRSYWARNAARYDRSMLLLGGPMPRVLERVAAELVGAGDVLEIGAGTGLVTVAIAGVARRVIATDYAPAMVERLVERVRRERLANVECRVADLQALEFEPGSFDAVVCANVLHLVPDLRVALAAMKRVLRPGGRLLVPTYAHDENVRSRVLSRLLALTGFPGQRRFTTGSLQAAVEEAGFEVDAAEVIQGLLPVAFVSGVSR